jgi:hypothetical protein
MANRSLLAQRSEPTAEDENKLPGPARFLFGSKKRHNIQAELT